MRIRLHVFFCLWYKACFCHVSAPVSVLHWWGPHRPKQRQPCLQCIFLSIALFFVAGIVTVFATQLGQRSSKEASSGVWVHILTGLAPSNTLPSLRCVENCWLGNRSALIKLLSFSIRQMWTDSWIRRKKHSAGVWLDGMVPTGTNFDSNRSALLSVSNPNWGGVTVDWK